MDASATVNHLLEDPETDHLDNPEGALPLAHYTDPVPFDPKHVADVLETAKFFKQQAIDTGALSPRVIGNYRHNQIDRVFLLLAVEDMAATEPLGTLENRLKRHMHSIWD